MGARQVGKTYIVDDYFSHAFEKYIKIDLLKDPRIINMYLEKKNSDDIFETIQLEYGINFNDTVVFFDEIQKCHKLIEDLKYLCINYPKARIICAGSLLGVSYRETNISMPVRYVIEEYMYPLDFEEFLVVTGNERYIPVIRKCYDNNEPMNDTLHKSLLDIFYRFLFLGGMPEVVQNYLDNNQSLVGVDDKIIKNIINIYKEDMSKYITSIKERMRIERIYDKIIPQLSKENPKFMFAKIDDTDNRKRDYISALDWLTKSNIIYTCNQITKPVYPIKFFKNVDAYKIFLNDTGIMANLAEISASNIIMDGDYQAKGILAENYVATELVKHGFSLLYYSQKGMNSQSIEIDFIIQIEDKVIPIEVKAANDKQMKSLKYYIEKFNPLYSIKLSSSNFGFQNRIKTVPLYATFCIEKK